ncbi:hypothetical protein Celaphus_00007553 [Cervus elaphus hippelaphus]|uniref:Uncharacterized protein n=1 Tax=Cervus elaphus hippelaphus TaxID=46360 RepID=A0A212CB77_CEREH|nr:hypothetical protein Celaphus_00007553 [Cervus elaphus hippelaphus]
MDCSTISTILKVKGEIMEHVKSAMLMMSTIILKKCGTAMEEMEKLLRVQRQNHHQCRLWPSPRNGAWNNLCPQLIHNFRGLEKGDEGSEEVFSN